MCLYEQLEAALDAGVDVNARDDHGNSLFILACQQGNKRLAKLLMRRHADLNLQVRGRRRPKASLRVGLTSSVGLTSRGRT